MPSSDAKLIIGETYDQAYVLLNCENGKIKYKFPRGVLSLGGGGREAFSLNNQYIAFRHDSNKVSIFDLKTKKTVKTITAANITLVTRLTFGAGNMLFIGGSINDSETVIESWNLKL